MKTHIAIVTATLLALARYANAAPPDPLEIHRHVVDALQSVHDKFPEPLKKFTETFPPIAWPRQAMIALAQVDAPQAPGPLIAQAGVPPVAPVEPLVDTGAIADWANNFATLTTKATLDGIFPRSAPRKPVIVGGAGNAKANAAMEEDLNVMMRILEKAAGGKDETRPTAGGIELFSFGKANAPRVFYIEGYGAMFVLNVKYPLLAPAKDDQSRTNEPTNSEWEKAREEVYGGGRGNNVRFTSTPGEEFDASRVENLKNQLTEDLLNAKNIRGLKTDDSVTVVVLGGGTRGTVTRRVESRPPATGGRGGVGGRAGAAGGGFGGGGFAVMEATASGNDTGAQTTMTLRVKKSDVDKFAKEKQRAEQDSSKPISQIVEEFAKKVSAQIY
jgi:hypothetical protein